jgi:hypothetical protein
MGFESGLVARQVGDVDWELVEPLMYRGNTELFKVPIETKTDFASQTGHGRTKGPLPSPMANVGRRATLPARSALRALTVPRGRVTRYPNGWGESIDCL